MSAHTPGPWTASHNSWEVSVIYAPCGEIARAIIDSEADDETQSRFEAIKEANARLIAAAPDLLEALEDCIDDAEEVLQRMIEAYGPKFRVERQNAKRKQIAKARAAIRKATGAE